MEQIKYQGYARERGFNPIQMSTASVDAIGQQGNNLLRQMKENSDIERRNRDAYQSQVEQNQGIERQNRDENRQFERQSNRNYFEGSARNLKTQADNYLIKSEDTEKAFTALAGLSGTLAKIVKSEVKRRGDAAEIEAMNLVAQYSVSPDKLARYKEQVAKLEKSETAVNRVVNSLEFEGTPIDVLQKISEMSGRRLYGATKQFTVQGALEYPVWRAQKADTEFQVGNDTFTLNSASSREQWEYANSQLRTQFLRNYLGINPILLAEHLLPKMGEQEAIEKASYSDRLIKAKTAEKDQQDRRDLYLSLEDASTDPGETFLKSIYIKAGVDENNRSPFLGQKAAENFKILAELADAKMLKQETFDRIKAYTYRHNDGSVRRIDDTFGLLVASVQEKLDNRVKQDYQDREFKQSQVGEEIENLALQKHQSEGFNDVELQQVKEKYFQETGGRTSAVLEQLASRTTEAIQSSVQEQNAQYLANRKLLTTKELMRPGRYSEAVISKFKRDAEDGDRLGTLDPKSVTQQLDLLNARAQELLGQTGNDKKDSSAYKWAQIEIERIMKEKALSEISKGNRDGALQVASEYVLNLLWDGKESGKGPFAINANAIGSLNPYKGMGQSKSYVAQVQQAGQIAKQLRTNADYLRTTVVLDPDSANQLKKFAKGNGGAIPSLIFTIAKNSSTLSAVDIINSQLEALGEKPLQPVMSEQVRQGLSPMQRRILEYRPSAANTYQAFGMTPGPDPYRPLLELIASKESQAHGHYDAMNSGGHSAQDPIGSANSKDVFGRGLSAMTVSQVLELQGEKKVFAAGRYQIIPGTLSGLLAGKYGSTGVNLNDLFNAANQDKLAVALLRHRAGRFFNGSGTVGDAVVGMGNEWAGLEKVSKKIIAQRLENVRVALNSQNMWRQPENMRTGLVYRIGSRGYGSTGPHLDVKRVDRGTTQTTGSVPIATTELDDYVDVQVGGKWKALSRGTTVTDHEQEHRNRSSYGVDFAANDGTPVRLKNGAVVVGSFKGDEGTDHLIVQLPDGRRFQFLHGTNA